MLKQQFRAAASTVVSAVAVISFRPMTVDVY